MLLSEVQMSDYKGAALMLDALPGAKALLGDQGYDADWFVDTNVGHGAGPTELDSPILDTDWCPSAPARKHERASSLRRGSQGPDR